LCKKTHIVERWETCYEKKHKGKKNKTLKNSILCTLEFGSEGNEHCSLTYNYQGYLKKNSHKVAP